MNWITRLDVPAGIGAASSEDADGGLETRERPIRYRRMAENADAARDEIRSMLQTLLAERFRLVVHRERKVMPDLMEISPLRPTATQTPEPEGDCRGGASRNGIERCENL